MMIDGFQTLTTPRPAPVRSFPLVASACWNNPKARVLWTDVHPGSKFGMAVRALKLPYTKTHIGTLECETDLETLTLVLLKAWGWI